MNIHEHRGFCFMDIHAEWLKTMTVSLRGYKTSLITVKKIGLSKWEHLNIGQIFNLIRAL